MPPWSRLIFFALRATCYQRALKRAKARGVILYLKCLRLVRRSLLATLLVFFLTQIMIFGLVGTIVCSVFLTVDDWHLRLWILAGIFGACLAVPLILFLFFFSEKVWFELSGAKEMVRDTTAD